ncbi:DUF6082 family protein [Phytohabitans houttuyneae]|uniref:Uncharacterized protein n=1 Tax=Phytohabitans houttuyneae TaxID=1076126 RepID=A0A6V8K506_9ACTN|nr:DUF6082 family protein [Phytohabitans houttuyneae]GFJ77259.1 hypothetical protein Phou_014390 [Phytohabitans houttuyneae]
MRTPTSTRTTLIAAALAGLAVACAAGFPLALAIIDRWWQPDWRRLADIGQAYGAASAVFSALAVAGVAAGLIYQGRQLRLVRIQVARDKHEQLMTLAINDHDTYGPMFGSAFAAMPPTQLRRRLFCVMALNYFRLGYEGGVINEKNLRAEVLPAYFSAADSRQHWAAASQDWLAHQPPIYRRFGAIVNDEYRRAVASGPPTPEPIQHPLEAVTPPQRRPATTLVGAMAAAAVAGWLIGRRR